MLCLPFMEINCSYVLWNETLLQLLNVFYAYRKCLCFIMLCLLSLFYSLLLVFCNILEPNRCFTSKVYSSVCDGFVDPNYQQHC
jgi:hypothetical protein